MPLGWEEKDLERLRREQYPQYDSRIQPTVHGPSDYLEVPEIADRAPTEKPTGGNVTIIDLNDWFPEITDQPASTRPVGENLAHLCYSAMPLN